MITGRCRRSARDRKARIEPRSRAISPRRVARASPTLERHSPCEGRLRDEAVPLCSLVLGARLAPPQAPPRRGPGRHGHGIRPRFDHHRRFRAERSARRADAIEIRLATTTESTFATLSARAPGEYAGSRRRTRAFASRMRRGGTVRLTPVRHRIGTYSAMKPWVEAAADAVGVPISMNTTAPLS